MTREPVMRIMDFGALPMFNSQMILGINTSHDAAFCLLDARGNPVFLLEEERFNRIKHTGFNTFISLETAIDSGIFNPETVTDLVYSFEMDEGETNALMNKCYENVINSYGADVFLQASQFFHQPEHYFSLIKGTGLTKNFDEVTKQLLNLFPNARESSYKHHLCHAASAFYPSPFNSAALLIIDGSGRLETTTIWYGGINGLELLHQIELPHSLGVFYWLFSQYLGLEEGQTMGLAAYGTPIYRNLIYEQILETGENGKFAFKAPIVSWFDMDSEYALRIIENLFKRAARDSRQENLKQFHADVAASLQAVTEEIFIEIARYAKKQTGENNLCLAGGVVQNCVANGRLVSEGIFKNVWIQPVANDAGTALGAALHHFHTQPHNRKKNKWKMTSAQLGLAADKQSVKNLLRRLKINFKESKTVAEDAARRLAEGKIIGWFQAKAEVGPRALGGRSILADARTKYNSFAVNEIKQRQPWRPFAPSVSAEKASGFFEMPCASPYMILSFPIKNHLREKFPAISHTNGSARVQTVSSDVNGIYYDLLKAFEKITGNPVILNTSFNLKGEPIAQHPLEAIRDFLLTDIDALFLNDYLIEEKPTLPPDLKDALDSCKFISLYDVFFRNVKIIYFISHKSFSARQQRVLERLKILLKWLGIKCAGIPPDEFNSTIETTKENFHLISIFHFLDSQLLRRLEEGLYERLTVFVIDSQMFPTRITPNDFLRVTESNCRKLYSLVANKNVFVWSDEINESNILNMLDILNIPTAGTITSANNTKSSTKTFPPEYLKNSADAFLIISSSIMDKHKSELRKLGYYSEKNYLVWESDYD